MRRYTRIINADDDDVRESLCEFTPDLVLLRNVEIYRDGHHEATVDVDALRAWGDLGGDLSCPLAPNGGFLPAKPLGDAKYGVYPLTSEQFLTAFTAATVTHRLTGDEP